MTFGVFGVDVEPDKCHTDLKSGRLTTWKPFMRAHRTATSATRLVSIP